jgi:hypothetical protein
MLFPPLDTVIWLLAMVSNTSTMMMNYQESIMLTDASRHLK